jgi:hypothetical protein
VSTVRDLEVPTDSDWLPLTLIWSFRRHLAAASDSVLVVSLIHMRLDYGNFIFVGFPARRLRLLQSILNAAVCLMLRLRRYDYITDALAFFTLAAAAGAG